MSQPFNAGTPPVSNGHVLASAPAPYHPALPNFSSFPGLNSFAHSLNGQSQMSLSTPTQQSFFPHLQRPPSSDNSDLEKLERLKKEILEGQNPIYKAVPQPNFLESLYLGRSLQAQNSAPAHPNQVSSGPSASSAPHSPAAMHSDGDAKTTEVGRSAPTNHSGEISRTSLDAKVQHNSLAPSASFQVAPNMNGTVKSSYPDGISLSKPSSMPQVGPKTSQNDQRPSYPSDMSVLDASMFSSSNGAVDSAKNGHHIPHGQSAVHPISDNLPVQSTTDSPQTTSDSLNKSVSSRDPPYDPKESLRRPEDSTVLSDERSRHADSYDSRTYDSRYGRSMDSSRDRERERDRDRERDRPYDYRYDERRNIPDDYGNRHSSMSSIDSKDLHFQDLRRQDSRHIQDDRMDVDVRRLAPGVSDRSFRLADDRISRDPPSNERTIRSTDGNNVTKPTNGVDEARFVPSSTAPLSVNSHSASADDRLTRTTAPSTYVRPVDERSRPDDRTRFQPVGQPFADGSIRHPNQVAETNAAPALEERIGSRAPPALEERIGIRIPLEERITSPPIDRLAQSAPALQERIGERPPLEDRIGSRPASADVRGSAGVESSRSGDLRSIPTPLSLVRPRPVDEKAVSSSPVSASTSARVSHQRVEDRPALSSASDNAERPDGILQPRYSTYGNDHRTPVQGSPLVANNTSRPSLSEEAILREKHIEASDPRLVPSVIYRDDRDRRYTEAGRSITEVVHYERPILRERDSAYTEDRVRPSLDTREWRERVSYPPRNYSVSRSETHPLSGSNSRVWTTNSRGNRPSDSTSDERGRYIDRDYDRRSTLVPRSWDRDDVRPPPEVYPLPGDIDRERHALAEFREASRVRARSPSPNPLRRSTLGGSLDDLRPAKRVRDDGYYDDRERRYSDHHARAGSPPPSTAASYYDTRPPYTPRDVPDPYYERRVTDMGPPREPPYTGRAIYSRPDLDKYNLPPPRTA